ncbi:MAG: anion permease [Magnetococcales bacterium]|nr:anion permease [Magnetococcales bacterium]
MPDHSLEPDLIERQLQDPILGLSNYTSLSRLMPLIEVRDYPAGAVLCQANTPSEGLFLLTDGRIALSRPDGTPVSNQERRCGEESATDFKECLVQAVVLEPVRTLFIPRASVQLLAAEQPVIKQASITALMSHVSGHPLKLPTLKPASSGETPSTLTTHVGWLSAILLPAVVLYYGEQFNLESNITTFLAISSATILMWMFSLVDDYIPGLFAIVSILMAGLVPPSVVLSGFSSNSFLMAMSILGLSTVIASSGLGYRTLLLLLYRLPNTRFWNNLGLILIGFVLTPLIPSINARLAMVTPFFTDMVKNLRLVPEGKAATRLAISAFTGVSLMSAMFITSKSVNFAMFSLLPTQAQDQFQGFRWLVAAGVFGLFMLFAHILADLLLMRTKEQPQLDKSRVALQLQLLGKLKHREWAALLGIGVFILGMMTSSWHQIQPTLLGMSIFYALLLFGSLRKKELTEKIDWPFLLYLGELTGLVSVFNYLGLDQHLATALPTLGATMRDHFELFVLLLFVMISLVRLVIPISITIVILITLFMPLAEIYGIHPWIVGFIILIFGEIWFMPYQCSYYQKYQEINQAQPLYKDSTFLIFNALMNIFRLLAIYASFPYWRAMGLL